MFLGGATVAEHIDRVQNNPRLAERGVSLVVSPLYHTGPLGSIRSKASIGRTAAPGISHQFRNPPLIG